MTDIDKIDNPEAADDQVDQKSAKTKWWDSFMAKKSAKADGQADDSDADEALSSEPVDNTADDPVDESPEEDLGRPDFLPFIEQLYKLLNDDSESLDLSDSSFFTSTKQLPSPEEFAALLNVNDQLKTVVAQYRAFLTEEPLPGVEHVPLNMRLFIALSDDNMQAFGFLIPQTEGGESLTEQEIDALLASKSIVHGADRDRLLTFIKENRTFVIFSFAEGTAAIDGADGQIIEHFARENKMQLVVDEKQAVDYKNLNMLQHIASGDIICDIIHPVQGTNGQTVLGAPVKAYSGKLPRPPIGSGVAANEEGTQIIAQIDGQLSYKNGLFRIDPLVEIKGNVDNSTGNLNVIGDCVIKGNVDDGFSIKATGSISVSGIVEGAFLEAGGDIKIALGMKGNRKGTLTAKGSIACKYLESCTVRAAGNIVADSIINSHVISGDSIIVTNDKGSIIGGRIEACNLIRAKAVGNEFNNITHIHLGDNAFDSDPIYKLNEDVDVLKSSIAETEKNISYLEAAEKLTKEYEQLLSQLKIKLTTLKMRLSHKERTLELKVIALEQINAQLIAGTIYPSTIIHIRHTHVTTRSTYSMSRVYLNKEDGEIVFGSGTP